MQIWPVLYSFRRCPYAMRARLALVYCGCQVELREVVLRDKPAQLMQTSAKATVPVLVLPDGNVVDESFDIMLWAIEESGNVKLLECDRQEQLSLIQRCDVEFKPLLDNYKYFQRQPQLSQIEHREKAVQWLQCLNTRLAQQEFLCGAQLMLSDLAIFPFVRQFAHVDRQWFYACELTHVQCWLQACLDLALFTEVMKKYEQWQEGDQATLL